MMPILPDDDTEFRKLLHSLIRRVSVVDRLKETRHGAVVLERIANGAGEEYWYWCPNETQLDKAELLFSPGSCISFYFDGRIRAEYFTASTISNIESLLATIDLTWESLAVGVLEDDGPRINMTFMKLIAGVEDLDTEFTSESKVFYGIYPDRDDDGIKARTMYLPDEDCKFREHSY